MATNRLDKVLLSLFALVKRREHLKTSSVPDALRWLLLLDQAGLFEDSLHTPAPNVVLAIPPGLLEDAVESVFTSLEELFAGLLSGSQTVDIAEDDLKFFASGIVNNWPTIAGALREDLSTGRRPAAVVEKWPLGRRPKYRNSPVGSGEFRLATGLTVLTL